MENNKNINNREIKNFVGLNKEHSFKNSSKIDNQKKQIIFFGNKNNNLVYNLKYGDNTIKTTRYNMITLIPKSLFYQFTRVSNIYFLIVSILTCMPFSPKESTSMIGTFVFVLTFTMLKDALEDFNRYQNDKISNNMPCFLLQDNKWVKERCYKLRPGNIIKLNKNEECSCDILLLYSSNKEGYIYLDTKNLDGETNLKEKCILEELKEYNINENELENLNNGMIETTKSDPELHFWEGYITYKNKNSIYCNIKNIILKGCILKNTEYIIGVVVYSGSQTKIMKNNRNPIPKFSKIIKIMNFLMYSLFIFTMVICFSFALFDCKFVNSYYNKYDYIFYTYDRTLTKNKTFYRFILNFLTFFVAYAQIIPISLYVVMEIIKIYQTILIFYDFELYDLEIDKPCSCRESGLIEELGQIDFIFSDKTGTLTQNIMEFKKCFINGKVYGSELESNDTSDAYHTINGDPKAYEKLISIPSLDFEYKDKECLERFFTLLCLCHDVFPEYVNKKIEYQGSSPDDIALVKGAQQLGFEFIKKNYQTLIVVKHLAEDVILNFELLTLIPFDSERKRMSVIVKDKQNNKIFLFSKGSDNIMITGTNNHPPIITEYTYINEQNEVEIILEKFSKEGLRILVMGYKELEESYFKKWLKNYENQRKKNPKYLKEYHDEMEKNLIFCGCSAIEDKLQEDVPETIDTLINCGLRIWMLTGDKQDTAEQIGKQSKLINDETVLYNLSVDIGNKNELYDKISELISKFYLDQFLEEKKFDIERIYEILNEEGEFEDSMSNISLIVDGISLENILSDETLRKMFFLLGIISKSVICCRVSPKQKSDIVKLTKNYGNFVTLSIGDGANDVPMIMEASIGVGVQGQEGTQAVRSADYSIGKFKFLEKLILFYGRNGYIKISKYICYYFYKNIVLVITELLFVFYDGWSGQIFFPDWYGTMFNAIFTSWPCIFVFAYEKEHDVKTCKKFPILYRAGPKNVLFNLKVFWVYILFGLIHSILCFYIPACGLRGYTDINGSTMDNWRIATVSFTLVIHVVSMKLIIISEFWNKINLLFTVISIIFYYIVLIAFSTNSIGKIFQPEVIGVFFDIISNMKSLFIIIFAPFIICLPDIMFKQIFFTYIPTPSEYITKFKQDKEYIKILNSTNIKTNKEGKILINKTSIKYTQGYIMLSQLNSRKKESGELNKNNEFNIKEDNINLSKIPFKTSNNFSNGNIMFDNHNILDNINDEFKKYRASKSNLECNRVSNGIKSFTFKNQNYKQNNLKDNDGTGVIKNLNEIEEKNNSVKDEHHLSLNSKKDNLLNEFFKDIESSFHSSQNSNKNEENGNYKNNNNENNNPINKN